MTRVKSTLRPDLCDRNAIAFIRARGLEIEFRDWCGGWPVPSAEALGASPASPAIQSSHRLDELESALAAIRERASHVSGRSFGSAATVGEIAQAIRDYILGEGA